MDTIFVVLSYNIYLLAGFYDPLNQLLRPVVVFIKFFDNIYFWLCTQWQYLNIILRWSSFSTFDKIKEKQMCSYDLFITHVRYTESTFCKHWYLILQFTNLWSLFFVLHARLFSIQSAAFQCKVAIIFVGVSKIKW